jgi:HlyD family secretion protein
MKNGWLIVLALLVALLPLAGCEGSSSSDSTPAGPTGAAVPDQESSNVVSATGEVRPAQRAGLSFLVDGQVEAVLAEEGQAVTAGQPLVQLDAVRLARAINEAQAALAAAEAELARLKAGVQATQAQLALVQAQAAMTEAQVTAAQAAVAQAESALEAAQAQAALDRLRAGPTVEDLAVAEAAVTRAREALLTAQAMHDQATLAAPFDGTVTIVQVRQGEQVLPGQVVLMLGDLSTLQVETTDLDEVDVARVQPGQQVGLTFDALPDRVLAGHIVRIAPMATPGQGATTYTAVVAFDETDPALRWGMTAFVDIEVER